MSGPEARAPRLTFHPGQRPLHGAALHGDLADQDDLLGAAHAALLDAAVASLREAGRTVDALQQARLSEAAIALTSGEQ